MRRLVGVGSRRCASRRFLQFFYSGKRKSRGPKVQALFPTQAASFRSPSRSRSSHSLSPALRNREARSSTVSGWTGDVELEPARILLNAVTTSHTDVRIKRPHGVDEVVAFSAEITEALAQVVGGFRSGNVLRLRLVVLLELVDKPAERRRRHLVLLVVL